MASAEEPPEQAWEYFIKSKVPNNHICDKGHNEGDQEMFYWNKVVGSRFKALINDALETIIQGKRDLLMLPTGFSGRKYIDETTCLFNLWVNDTLYELVELKTIHMMPALILSMSSKSK